VKAEEMTGAIATFSDITERRKFEEQIRKLAFFNPQSELDADRTLSESQASVVSEKIRAILAEPFVLQLVAEDHSCSTIDHRPSTIDHRPSTINVRRV
jgi:hypothetical protein